MMKGKQGSNCLGVWLIPLLLVSGQSLGQGFAFGAPPGTKPPSEIRLRSLVLIAPPLAFMANDSLDFANFQGVFPDTMRELQRIALKTDNVTLTFEMDSAPVYFEAVDNNTWTNTLKTVQNDCNTSANPLPLTECNRYDLLVGDYWPSAGDRSIKLLFTPPLLQSRYVSGRLTSKGPQFQRPIESLEDADARNATICLDAFDLGILRDLLREFYPNVGTQICGGGGGPGCYENIKDPNECALWLADNLKLRTTHGQDPDFSIYQESIFRQDVSWAVNSRLDPTIQFYLHKWIYHSHGYMDRILDSYFGAGRCPRGKAGINCDLPCHPLHGLSDRYGKCICDSTKWTGNDCSIEVMQDTNMIPPGIKMAAYVMAAINIAAVAVCAVWLFVHRSSPQVDVAQPHFLCLVLIGCLVSTSTIFALAQEDSGDGPVLGCALIPWLYSIGFCITFGTLASKIRRVYILFKAAAELKRVTVSAVETFSVVAMVLLIDVIILVVWTVVDSLQWQRYVLSVDKYGSPLSTVGFCTSTHWKAFTATIAAYHFGLMLVTCAICYRARNLPTLFSEGHYLAIAMISNLQIFVVAVPVLVVLGSHSQAGFFVRSVVIWMNDFVVLLLIFGNLMYSFHFGDEGLQQMSRAALIRESLEKYHKRNNGDGLMRNSQAPYPSVCHCARAKDSRTSTVVSEAVNLSSNETLHADDTVQAPDCIENRL